MLILICLFIVCYFLQDFMWGLQQSEISSKITLLPCLKSKCPLTLSHMSFFLPCLAHHVHGVLCLFLFFISTQDHFPALMWVTYIYRDNYPIFRMGSDSLWEIFSYLLLTCFWAYKYTILYIMIECCWPRKLWITFLHNILKHLTTK